MAKTRWVCVFCKRIMRSISGGLEELKSNKLFYVLFEKKWRIQYSVFFWKCEGLHQKFISKVLEILVNTHLEDLPIVNVHIWKIFQLWTFIERSFCGFLTKTWQFIWYCWYTTVNFVTREKYLKWGEKIFMSLLQNRLNSTNLWDIFLP